MSLRARLALALAALAAAAAAAVAVTGYRATNDRLMSEMDSSIAAYAGRLADPDGRLANQVCAEAARASVGRDDGDERGPGRDLQGITIQCVVADGTVVAGNTDPAVPVSSLDLAAARGTTTAINIRTVDVEGADVRVGTVGVKGGAVMIARPAGETDRVLAGLRWRYVLLVAGVTGLAAAMGWWIARRVTRPVLALTDTAERIAAGDSDLGTEVDVSGSDHDEVARLARAFASMLAALRRSRDQQQRLVQDAGHELRTPLTSLRANVSTLQRHPDLDGPRRDAVLADLDGELRELTTLANELVTLAADPGADEVPGPCDLADLARTSVERARRRTGREIVAQLTPSPLVGQSRQLRRVIDNLVENAAKFSPAGTPIEVTVWPGMVVVRDHGPGIAEADLPHVFERFYRSTGARSLPGSGLGLSIVAEVARRHGGVATAANHPDGGAMVTVSVATMAPLS